MRHLTPTDTWQFLQRTPEALFVDVRMEIEYLYVGHPPGVVHIAWYEYPEMRADAEGFVRQVRREGGREDRPVVLLCRSGGRSAKNWPMHSTQATVLANPTRRSAPMRWTTSPLSTR